MTALEIISMQLLGCQGFYPFYWSFYPSLAQRTPDEREEPEGVVQLRSISSWCLVESKVAEVAAMQTRAVSSSFSSSKACGLCVESCGI